jgi:AbrB family looped-hinge helix DNA binding protein
MKRKLGSKGQVVIPKEIRKELNLSEGSTLTFEVSDRTILVRPEPSPEEVVRQFLSVRGRKRRRPVDWKSIVDEEYKAPGR